MKSRLVGSTVRDLALTIGLACGLIALLLVCASVSMPPVAADQEEGELWPAWTTTEPTSTLVTNDYKVWNIQEYSTTITFWTGAIKGTAVVTFAPRTDLELPLPWLPTAYIFEVYGTYLDTGASRRFPPPPPPHTTKGTHSGPHCPRSPPPSGGGPGW